MALSAYHIGAHLEGFLNCEILLRERGSSKFVKDTIRSELKLYVPKITVKSMTPIRNELDTIQWRITNPSLVHWGDGYLLNVRHVNYEVTSEDHCVPRLGAPTVITRNFLHHLDDKLNILKTVEIQDDISAYDGRYIQGLEDMRLFCWRDELYGMPNSSYFTLIQQINLVKINPHTGVIEERYHLDYDHDPKALQKNWLPVVTPDDCLKVIYSHDPTTIFDVSPTGELTTAACYNLTYTANSFRGSAAPIPYGDDGGYLGVVHDVCHPVESNNSEKRRLHYYSRFVWYDRDLRIKKVTLPFYWFHKGVEYLLSMVWNKTKTALLVCVSFRDETAYIVELDPKEIDKLPTFVYNNA